MTFILPLLLFYRANEIREWGLSRFMQTALLLLLVEKSQDPNRDGPLRKSTQDWSLVRQNSHFLPNLIRQVLRCYIYCGKFSALFFSIFHYSTLFHRNKCGKRLSGTDHNALPHHISQWELSIWINDTEVSASHTSGASVSTISHLNHMRAHGPLCTNIND